MVENRIIQRLEKLGYSNPEKVGKAEFKDHNSQFTEDFAQLLTITYNLNSSEEQIGTFLSSYYWYGREALGDMISMHRKAMKRALENIQENERDTIGFSSKFYDGVLDINSEIDPKRELIATGFKTDDKGIVHFKGLEEQITRLKEITPQMYVVTTKKDQEYAYQILSNSEIIYVTDRRN